jgi:AAA+ superfamily predicted ATPase
MNQTIFEKFQSLPICFEYFFKQLSAFAFEKVQTDKIDELEQVSKSLNLTKEETLVLAVVFYLQNEKYPEDIDVIIRLIAHVLDKNVVLYEIFYLFEKLDIIEFDYRGQSKKVVMTREYFKAIKDSNFEKIKKIKPIGLLEMLSYFNRNICNRKFLTMETIRMELEYLSNLNPDLAIVKKVFTEEDPFEAFTIGALCAAQVHKRTSFEMSYLSDYVADFFGRSRELKRKVAEGKWKFIQNGWIKISGEGYVHDNVKIELENKGIQQLLPELTKKQRIEVQLMEDLVVENIIVPESIKVNTLYFNDTMKKEVKTLESLCGMDFGALKTQKDLVDVKGVNVLLYGPPGTGKTELALQLARISKRPLYKVEVNQILSKWVGESEQLLKQHFVKYKRLLRNRQAQPIFFLNECDQLLSKRVDVQYSVDQMHNNLQNIMLEEFENFEGLMLATTNLVQNLDKAFERRFLYKISFEKPSTEVLMDIWKQFLPQLSNAELKILIDQFNFNAGEIKNIAKKMVLSQMMNLKENVFDMAKRFCESEKLGTNRVVKIGF